MMGDQKKGGGITWTNATWNPIRGCTRVSEGCRNCYAERTAARFCDPGQPYHGLAVMKEEGPRWTGEVQFVEDHLFDPIRWKRPRMIFVNSMSDLFHEKMPDKWIDDIFAVMAASRRHIFQVLTKRPERMKAYLSEHGRKNHIWHLASKLDIVWETWPLQNVWLGISAEDQATLDERLPFLLETPAAVRWLSAEPLLGPMHLPERAFVCPGDKSHPPEDGWCRCLDWVVAGGESGPGARPMLAPWAQHLRDQCQEYSVPFFFKQWGEWLPEMQPTPCTDLRLNHSEYWMGTTVYKVGKKMAGDWLDGRPWREFPEIAG